MATGRVKTELEESRCSICLETPRDPTTLPCQHAFCKTCIAQYVYSKETETKQNYSCPVCRTDLSSEKQQILAFGNSTQKEMETENKFKCGPCREKGKDTLAIKWCRDCQDPFCKNCAVEHSSFKSLKNHEVSFLEEMQGQKDIRFLFDFSSKCPFHSEHLVEGYCFDHRQLCCFSCVTTIHKKCENISTIKDLNDSKNESRSSILMSHVSVDSDLSKIQTATDEFLQEKMAEKSQVEQSFLDIEESVNTTVQKVKDNLDTLMISFRKELHLKQDNYEAEVDQIIKKAETFRETIANALQNIEFVRNYGTATQLFIYLEKTKHEMKRIVEERIKPILETPKLEIQLVLNDVIQNMEQLSNLGQLELHQKADEASSTFRNQMNGSFCKLISIDTIKVKRDKVIHVIETGETYVRGGTSVDDTTILVACEKKIKVFNILTAKKMQAYATIIGTPKRLSYDEPSKFLYISFYYGHFHRIKYDNTQQIFSDLYTIKSALPNNGGVCNDGQSFYSIVDEGVCKIDDVQTYIFKTDTDSFSLNGLVFDKMNKRFIYTSNSYEVVVVTEQGEEIFRYKDENMTKVSSVAVLDCGDIIAGDESGQVHVISEEGKHRKTLIEKCEKITIVCDVWVDKDSKTLFVCGDSCVEIYNIYR